MEKPTPNPEHHQHHAHHSSEHELSADNQQPPDYENRDFSSPLAQPPLTNPPPTHQLEQDQNAPPQPQPQQQKLQSLPLQSLQSQSAPVVCPACGVRAMTITTEESGGFVHAIAALVCFFTCCGCIPYCISSLKDVHHQCGNCKMPIADYHRSGRTEVLAYQR